MEANENYSEDEKLLESRSSTDESASDPVRLLLQERRLQSQSGHHKLAIVGLAIALVASNLLWASFPITTTELCPDEGRAAAYCSTTSRI